MSVNDLEMYAVLVYKKEPEYYDDEDEHYQQPAKEIIGKDLFKIAASTLTFESSATVSDIAYCSRRQASSNTAYPEFEELCKK